jgi:septal ring factor EnvC (AmiA/AmiB activator)
MTWLKKAWKWILGTLAVVGAIALYILMSKDKTDEKVAELEDKIGEKEKEIQKWEEERNKHLDSADDASKEGKKLDKEIEKAKAKKVNLDDKREKMKSIFDKYNGSNGNG